MRPGPYWSNFTSRGRLRVRLDDVTFEISCVDCGTTVTPDDGRALCRACGGLLDYRYDLSAAAFDEGEPSIWRYRDLLPVAAGVEPVTLGEGRTPLTPARLDLGTTTWWKNETLNPTGSQKDRAMSVALTRARGIGIRAVFVASAGSTALAAAAYAARAGIPCTVLVGEESPERRLLPIAAYGARIFRVRGSVDDALDLLDGAVRAVGIHDVSTRRAGNPAQAEGPKTIAYEIVESLGRVPDWIVVPVGGGGTLAAIHRGFVELLAMGRADRLPRLASYQPIGYDTFPPALELAWTTDADLRANAFVDRPATVQVKIAHTYAPDGAAALAALRASGGTALSISDEEAVAGLGELAAVEGIFAEPSSGGVVPAVRRLSSAGLVGPGAVVVGIVGGNGFRELDAIESSMTSRAEFLPDGDPVAFLTTLQ
jgi:threonine synthase